MLCTPIIESVPAHFLTTSFGSRSSTRLHPCPEQQMQKFYHVYMNEEHEINHGLCYGEVINNLFFVQLFSEKLSTLCEASNSRIALHA